MRSGRGNGAALMRAPAREPRAAVAAGRRIAPSALAEAERWLVGGVNSPVRAFRRTGDRPLLLLGGRGAIVDGADRRRYVDFIMGWGALLLGHRPAPVAAALRRAMRGGAVTGLTHPDEARLAALIAAAVPSVERVRCTASGTEACMTAVRIARAQTGRAKILAFAGGYHGHSDVLLAGASAGVTAACAADLIQVPYNDGEALEQAVRVHGASLACAIVEPVAANMGVIPPQPGFLKRLRRVTAAARIILIFDEVVTGFRLGLGGAQAAFDVRPDLTVFGKIIGGGMPIGAVGGPRALMQRLAPVGDVYHAGTFAGHPLAMAAGAATLEALRAHPPYARLEALSALLADGLARAAAAAGLPIQVNRAGSMLTVFFSEHPVTNAADVAAGRADRFAAWARALRAAGILLPPSPSEAFFLSAAHTPTQIRTMIRVSRRAFQELAA